MSEVIVEALDGAKLVRAATIGGVQYVAVWHGGTTVNIYHPRSKFSDAWEETHVFTVQDEQGYAAERDVVDESIEHEFEYVASEARAEVRYGGVFK